MYCDPAPGGPDPGLPGEPGAPPPAGGGTYWLPPGNPGAPGRPPPPPAIKEKIKEKIRYNIVSSLSNC